MRPLSRLHVSCTPLEGRRGASLPRVWPYIKGQQARPASNQPQSATDQHTTASKDNADPSTQTSVAGHDRQGATSPSSEKNKRKDGDHRSSHPKRSRARQQPQASGASHAEDSDFQRDPAHKAGRLWTPEEGASTPRRIDGGRSKEKDGDAPN
ncbi:uncharacterized protein BDZ83DRAFT_77125 [Colletotrichum acutatum]|uniref:Uncharacterized protein n=1 Tax=Glomerella acutata TaxID=27357 RepID=A0AAD8X9U2_GLOAC|nr:uncharacterized protein BDZ83DRAFT_77125 [Colletotrichum acutatum]KAK1713791.1 hypothetical protein BDZ83DRAFT_77125 [Colletotrichum acutatum]